MGPFRFVPAKLLAKTQAARCNAGLAGKGDWIQPKLPSLCYPTHYSALPCPPTPPNTPVAPPPSKPPNRSPLANANLCSPSRRLDLESVSQCMSVHWFRKLSRRCECALFVTFLGWCRELVPADHPVRIAHRTSSQPCEPLHNHTFLGARSASYWFKKMCTPPSLEFLQSTRNNKKQC